MEERSDSYAEAPKLSLSWSTQLYISFLTVTTDFACRPNGSVNRRFYNFFDRKTKPKANPVNGVTSKDVIVDAAKDVWFRLFAPSSTTAHDVTLPVVMYFHGGGFAFLSPASVVYDALCRRFCHQLNAIVISVNYRLTPEHRYPCQYDDGFAAMKFLEENPSVLPENADLAKCFLAGDSAGANLAHHVAIRITQSELRRVRVLGLLSIQPFFGGEERTKAEIQHDRVPLVSVARTDWMWKAFLPNGSDRNHGSCNVSGPNALDISGLNYPNTLVFVGGFDPLQDWQRRYYEWLRKSGKAAQLIEYPTMFHAFYVFPNLPESSQLISQVKDFIANRVSNSE
ncbi:hypothetical protein HN51_008173 [Arachis hypogaea]|uniref:Probable carboxylesterase 18 isoform X1 n=1 Tax=Arachis duranensis TaxID=130453 RepID=A0A6P4DCI9_ARADU|nr:probable carboxylesterase 18 isoform X1 [Arachis duranensis]XP_025700457.1 probable carboxylesterase 18 [Arachis hypogaea]